MSVEGTPEQQAQSLPSIPGMEKSLEMSRRIATQGVDGGRKMIELLQQMGQAASAPGHYIDVSVEPSFEGLVSAQQQLEENQRLLGGTGETQGS